jgi:hypothetical protein
MTASNRSSNSSLARWYDGSPGRSNDPVRLRASERQSAAVGVLAAAGGGVVGDVGGVVGRVPAGADDALHATTTPDAAAPASIPSARRRLMSSGFCIASFLRLRVRDH